MKNTIWFGILYAVVYTISSYSQSPAITKHVLKNGLTVLIHPIKSNAKVSVQLWYRVGAKYEGSQEHGLAHLIEHMIFKGTEQLSETDIPAIAHKLSADCNAATSLDFTRYYFDVPIAHWQQVLPIIADCMRNCTFKPDLLNSELKTVVQELKMYRDDYQRQMVQELLALCFPDHPYHFPVIGYKQDLWNASSSKLKNFYRKYYTPNNAVLVIAGNVNTQEVIEKIDYYFNTITAEKAQKKERFYFNKDIVAHSVTLYRDVQRPSCALAFIVPGMAQRNDSLIPILHLALTHGRESRLYKKLINDLKIATSIESFSLGLFDHDLFCIFFDPINQETIDQTTQAIIEEFDTLKNFGLTEYEITRAVKALEAHYYDLMESPHAQASMLGETFLARSEIDDLRVKSPDIFEFFNQKIRDFATEYLDSFVMHKATLLPLPPNQHDRWLSLQQQSDHEDAQILANRIRESEIEAPRYALSVHPTMRVQQIYPKPKIQRLRNGLKILYHHNPNVPKISVQLKLKAGLEYDSHEFPGIYYMISQLLLEGTKKYDAAQLANAIESRAMHVSCLPGNININLLSADFEIALELLSQLVCNARFDDYAIEKIRALTLVAQQNAFDSPHTYVMQKAKEHIYGNHPYANMLLGTEESITKINKKDLVDFYKTIFTPQEACIAIVGDLTGYNIPAIVEKYLGNWHGNKLDTLEYPELSCSSSHTHHYYMNRDQTVLCIAGPSVHRFHPDYDKLLLFERILFHGMHSYTFKLRESTGAFYTISGSLIAASSYQPGFAYIKTIVSNDRLHEVTDMLKAVIKKGADEVSQTELEETKELLLCDMDELYATKHAIARTFLYLDYFNLPFNYFENRKQSIASITLDELKRAVKSVFNLNSMITIYVGRV